jgi:hypothetical protein
MTTYSRIFEIDPTAREAAKILIASAAAHPRAPEAASYLYFGNELEGCALHTIADVVEDVPV